MNYKYIERLFKDCFLAGVWFGQNHGLIKGHGLQADLTAAAKMQDLIGFLGGLGIEFVDGQIVVRKQED